VISWKIWRKKAAGRHEGKTRKRLEKDLAEADAYLKDIREDPQEKP
jgi:hypothetical protein